MREQDRFLKLFLRHQSDIRAYIGSMVRNLEDRDDLFEDVALVLWQKFSSYDSKYSFGAWARGIATNKILASRKKYSRSPVVIFSPETIQQIQEAYTRTESEAPLEQAALRACMEEVPAKSRRLLALRYEESLKLKELSKRLGSTLDAVHKALSRIRAKLQQCIERRLVADQVGGI